MRTCVGGASIGTESRHPSSHVPDASLSPAAARAPAAAHVRAGPAVSDGRALAGRPPTSASSTGHRGARLATTTTTVGRAAVPAVDVHNHLGRWLTDGQWCTADVDALLATMDAAGVETVVNLDGLWGDELEANLDRYDRAHPDRFLTFCQVEWALLAQRDGERRAQEQLRDSARRGARGVKVWKDLGLHVRDDTGALVLPDDPRVITNPRARG